MTGLYHFSQDAASNDVGAPPINWREGQPAGSVNGSAREMMAALANWHADTTGGGIAGTGSAGGVLAISTAQGLDLTRAFEVSFTVDGANLGPVNLTVDGSIQRPLQRPGAIPLGPGDLIPAVVYRSRWVPGLNRHVLVAPIPDPPGKIALFGREAAVPSGWVVCDGRALSRTAYAALFSAIGTVHGSTGSTDFKVPDFRGRAPFGADAMGGTAANRLTNAGGLDGDVGDVGGAETTALTVAQMPAHKHTGSTGDGGARVATTTGEAGAVPAGTTGAGGAHTPVVTAAPVPNHSHSGTATAETGHAHTYVAPVSKAGVAGSGSTNGPFWSGEQEASTGTTNPTFTVTTSPAGGHTPVVTADPVPSHMHSVPAIDAHSHAIPAVPAHTHPMALNDTGGGEAHPNIPPGLVVVFAIKA